MRGVLGDEAPGTPPCSIDPGPRSRAAVHRVQLMCPQRTCRVSRLSLRALTSRANNLNISPHLLYILRCSQQPLICAILKFITAMESLC